MAFNVKTLIRAELELDEAIYYYENIQSGLGKKFLLDYENTLNTLYSFPYFEENYNIIRRLPFKKFPYIINFTVDEYENTVYIHHISCTYQDPKNTRIKL